MIKHEKTSFLARFEGSGLCTGASGDFATSVSPRMLCRAIESILFTPKHHEREHFAYRVQKSSKMTATKIITRRETSLFDACDRDRINTT